EHPSFPVAALLRNATPERVALINDIHPNVWILEGSLDDGPIIQHEEERADVIINSASSDHWHIIRSTLAGLVRYSARKPGRPLLYILVGYGVIVDEARGQAVDSVKEWVRYWPGLEEYASGTLVSVCCTFSSSYERASGVRYLIRHEFNSHIAEAGPREDDPVRMLIKYPAKIYGVGEGGRCGILNSTLKLTADVGFAGTWGPGANLSNNIHVKNVVSAMLSVFEAALEPSAN
ncbi:hypothetical protein HETIRDRAFT_239716, partial [Heterobasidion irregulare TC 32-1]